VTDATPAAQGGLFEDIFEMFTSPSRVFERRRASGYGMLMLVLIVLTLIIAVATVGLTRPYWEANFEMGLRMAAEKGQPMPEGAALETARTFGVWGPVIGQALLVPIFVWLGGLFVLIAGKVAGAPVSYRQGCTIFTLAGFVRLISPVAMAIQGLLVDPTTIRSVSDAALGPARFFDPTTTSPVVMGILANFDLVGLWSFALVGIGIKVMGRGNSGSAWVGGGVVLLCLLALTIIPAAIF
jgi:hypothetical protein